MFLKCKPWVYNRDGTLPMVGAEMAIMEMLNDISDPQSFAHAAQVFEGLTVLRPDVINALLAACGSIKVKRLFLLLAAHFGFPWPIGWKPSAWIWAGAIAGSSRAGGWTNSFLSPYRRILVLSRFNPYFRQVQLIVYGGPAKNHRLHGGP